MSCRATAGSGECFLCIPQIAKVSLTGEAGTGKKVMADAASTLKHVTFELGGKSPLIIFADADLESAISAALSANFFSSGQVCSNATRVFVEDSICDEFIAKIKPRAEAMKLGDPFDSATQVGPLISRGHWEKVMSYIHSAHASGATHIVGGERPSNPELEKGNYVTPAIFSDCQDDMKFVREEIFGPVMSVLRFQSEEEVLKRANATDYGLSGGVFTRDFARAHRVARAIQAGTVWINDYNTTPPEVPFGGVKHSGLGRENGMQTIEHYTQLKPSTPISPSFRRITELMFSQGGFSIRRAAQISPPAQLPLGISPVIAGHNSAYKFTE